MKPKAILWLGALGAFVLYLLGYALFLAADAYLGGGQAYLWFLLCAPGLFILLCLIAGAVLYTHTQTAGAVILTQALAFFAFLLVVFAVQYFADLFQRDYAISLFVFDGALLCANPLLTYAGVRFVKLRRARKARRKEAKTDDKTASDPKKEEKDAL